MPRFGCTRWAKYAPKVNLVTVSETSALELPAVQLDSEVVRELMRQRVVTIAWNQDEQSMLAEFPLNVSLQARENLPFADPAMLPREGDLVAFYQGKISFADVFPESPDDTDSTTNTIGASTSSVDTSGILSYQIREFVEALPGIRQELERSVTTPATIRLAFLGPVSPVALAKEIAKSVAKGRSTTAAAFQLVELLACVQSVKPPVKAAERITTAWAEATRQTLVEIQRLYQELKAIDGTFTANANFRRYEKLVLSNSGGLT
jgi:hypothetical protein